MNMIFKDSNGNTVGEIFATGSWAPHYVQTAVETKQTIYLLIGAPSAGKSWVADQIKDKFEYISYDSNRKKTHMDLLAHPTEKIKVFDPTFKISTLIRRNPHINFVIICIYESEERLRWKMGLRNGKFTDTIMKRNEQVKKRFEKYGNGGFIGNSQEVLDYLLNLEV